MSKTKYVKKDITKLYELFVKTANKLKGDDRIYTGKEVRIIFDKIESEYFKGSKQYG
jgi:Fe-S cluster assembly iron-binding protein IscA|tara:strand:+ start:8559 stop:8729 length:171 start_codon:yes stop_codon:yes gene_type:complete